VSEALLEVVAGFPPWLERGFDQGEAHKRKQA
jgi:hypothetical protein